MMRLLERLPFDNFKLVSFDDYDPPPYAILSHTWTHGQEVTYSDLVAGAGKDKSGYDKIRFCGERAAADGLQYFWVDTCCIDKSTSDELSTAINSMFRWYKRASKCYVYMPDVCISEEVTDARTWEEAFRKSRWFTRGWTLQELLAPASVEFFSKEGKQLGNRISLEQEIHEITSLPLGVLRGQSLVEFDIEERLRWADGRETTMREDKAYCLLGIFGVFMPLIYGEGEKHALLRLKRKILKPSRGIEARSNEQTLDLPGNTQARSKPCSNVPFYRDIDFIDRNDILACIDERCSQPAGRAALVGFGGVGKSQLAIEYAHRVRKKSPETWVFWMHASNSARLEAAFSDVAEKVGLPTQPTAAVNTLQLVRSWLCDEANGRWLMIVDNADTDITIQTQKEGERVFLAALLPQNDHGAILITSRNADVARKLVAREKDIVKVGSMSQAEAIQLLENKLGDGPEVGAAQLVNALGCIPLAIVQAAAYINRLKPRMSVAKYLEAFKTMKNQEQLLYKTTPDVRRDQEASNSVLKTWQISFDHIHGQRPSAADLLSFMSFFNQQGIPEFMVRHYTDKDKPGQADSSESCSEQADVIFEEDVAVLRAFSLVGVTERGGEFEMHALVQFGTRMWLSLNGAERKWYQIFIRAMGHEFPDGEYVNWPKCQTLFPHVLPMLKQECLNNEKSGEWALLLNKAGWYAWRQGLFVQAEAMVGEALEIRKKVLGANDRDTLLSMSILGSVLNNAGKYSEAEIMHKQTFARSKEVLGPEHVDTLESLSQLGGVLYRQGRYEEAERICRQTLAQQEKVLGPGRYTLTYMSNLAQVLEAQGKYEEAESLTRQTLARREKEKELGPEHPDTLTSMSILAEMLTRQGKYTEAETMHRETLALQEKSLGPKHPDTLATISNLALILCFQRRYEEAESVNREALTQLERVLGSKHPLTLSSSCSLALVLCCQGKEEGESTNRQTLAHMEEVFGPDHLTTLSIVYNLACFLARKQRYNEAALLFERAYSGLSANLGKDHPTTNACGRGRSEMLAPQKQALDPRITDGGTRSHTGKGSKLLRGLARIGFESSIFSKK